MAIKSFFKKNKVWFITFIGLLIYDCLFILGNFYIKANDVSYEFHSVDYSIGFCSKILPGAIYNFLVGKYDMTSMTIYFRALSVILIFLISCVVQWFYNLIADRKIKNIFLLFVFFLTGPVTFWYFLYYEGTLDWYWLVFFLLAAVLLNNRVLRWLSPIFCALMVLVHNGSVLNYIPLLELIILLRCSVAEKRSEKISFAVIFAACVVFSVVPFVYFLSHDRTNCVFSSYQELDKWLEARGATKNAFYNWSFFGDSDQGKETWTYPVWLETDSTSSIVQFLHQLAMQVYITVTSTNYDIYLPALIYTLPVYAVFLSVIVSYIKQTSFKLRKFIGVCFFALPIINMSAIIFFSNDVLRWLGHAMICLIGSFMALVRYDYKEGFSRFEEITGKFKSWEVVVYTIGYALAFV